MISKMLQGQAVTAYNKQTGNVVSGFISIREGTKVISANDGNTYRLSEVRDISYEGRRLHEDADDLIDKLANSVDWEKVQQSGDSDNIVDEFSKSIVKETGKANEDEVGKAARERANAEIMKVNIDKGNTTVSEELEKYMRERTARIAKKFAETKNRLVEKSLYDDLYLDESEDALAEMNSTFIADPSDIEMSESLFDSIDEETANSSVESKPANDLEFDMLDFIRDQWESGKEPHEIIDQLMIDYKISEEDAEDKLAQYFINRADDEFDDFDNYDYEGDTDSEIEEILDEYEDTASEYSDEKMYEHICGQLGIENGATILRECNNSAPMAVNHILECVSRERLQEAVVSKVANAIRRTVGEKDLLMGSRAPKLDDYKQGAIKNWCTKLGTRLEDDSHGASVTLRDKKTFFSRVIDKIKGMFNKDTQKDAVDGYFENSANSGFFDEVFNGATRGSFTFKRTAPVFSANSEYRQRWFGAKA